ncbi:hypothetical protein [Nocardioides conyzicola]|uniref:Uncharacterized protein n=1 Tax=Nocardioides conyzicola TaxID=1651781 RepID=A0ABP8XCV8_9ACTN
MAKYLTCPFCGDHGIRTDEHVWAQWMHDTPGAVELLSESHGERVQRDYFKPTRDVDGRYQSEPAQLGPMATWLPNVKVPVCEACNSGWMSQLEEQVKGILGPFILEGKHPLRLGADDLRTIATWATKSWMSYALLRPPHNNPFTEGEYRTMASSPAPLARSQIWLFHSHESGAQVAMGIDSSLMGEGSAPDLTSAQDNWGYAYLAVSSVVLAMQVVPPQAPKGMGDVFAPPMTGHRAIRRIWPDLRPQFFPLGVVPDELVVALRRHPQEVFAAMGLPTEGLTDEDAEEVRRQFLAGADPAELRKVWGQSE